MIRLGTLFSGIGAIEQALLRMGQKHSIVFACDNGELDLKILPKDKQEIYDGLKKSQVIAYPRKKVTNSPDLLN